MSTDHIWVRAELERALLALSLPGREALATLPEGSVKADELALDYSHFLEVALENFGSEFSSAQLGALRTLSRQSMRFIPRWSARSTSRSSWTSISQSRTNGTSLFLCYRRRAESAG
jgi:hypothetical protein